MDLLFSQLPAVTQGKILLFSEEKTVKQLLTDSRVAGVTDGGLFLAIGGKTHDGHRFTKELYQKGIRQFVVEDETQVELSLFPEANILLVENTVKALQQIATWHRLQFSLPTIGITGSNGKTIIKEWLYQLLSPDFSIVKSPKSYNSQIGVPLSVWQIRPEHTLAIFEAGISRPDEMGHLAPIIRPTMGIFTNIGPAHSEGFPSMQAKIEEKATLFAHCKKIIYRKDHPLLSEYFSTHFLPEQIVSWGYDPTADYRLSKADATTFLIERNPELATLNWELGTGNWEQFHLPFKDDASTENLLHCIVLMLEMGIAANVIQQRIVGLANIPMRLELKAGRHNSYIIDDTYNNDPEGLKIALHFMQQQGMKRQKIVILSDMLETGIAPAELYKQVAALLKQNQISLFVGIGHAMGNNRDAFPTNSLFCTGVDEFLHTLPQLNLKDSLILVKGARTFRFERIAQTLTQKIHRTVLEVNLSALAHNLNVFRQMLKPKTKMMVMVKAFAYGSGSHEVAHLLQYNKVDYLAVAYTDEGVELRENNITLPIMVMNPSADEFDKLAKYNLEPELYSFAILKAFISYQLSVTSQQVIVDSEHTHHSPLTTHPLKIHLAIDTGMHRLGFEEPEINALCTLLKSSNIQVASVFSHLVGADETEHDPFSTQQAELFEHIAAKIETELGYPVIKHLLNSAGITRLHSYQYDMVRLGIGLYGIESQDHPPYRHLQNVGTLKTLISQIREVKKGESIGYSRKGVVEKDSRIATLAIGYADGYSRSFSNGQGKVWIKGKLAPIIGNVCMDMCMADITDVDAEESDEVIIFGEKLSVNEVAKWANTIPYEILTCVSERVKRVFYLE